MNVKRKSINQQIVNGIKISFFVVVGFFVICSLYLSFAVFISLCGGNLKGCISNLKPQPDFTSSRIESLRQSSVKEVLEEQNQINANTDLVFYESSSYDTCNKGENKLKRRQGFAYRCVYKSNNFYGFDGDFKTQLLQIEKNLNRSKWINQRSNYELTIPQVIKHYYDNPSPRVFKGINIVSNYPSASNYYKDRVKLEIDYAEAQSFNPHRFKLGQMTQVINFNKATYLQDKTIDSEVILGKITSQHKYFLMISVEKVYFEN